MTTPPQDYEYKVGGGLDSKAPSYVVRQADEEFYASLKAGKFCYVFNSRQMGKSSLQNRTAQRLRAEGIACGVVNLNFMEVHNATVAGWYQGIIGRLKSSLGIKIQYLDWWLERKDIPPLQRFVEFIETVLLVEISQPIVLFFDEIDSVFKFDFKDDFFALIRAFHEQRTEQSEYQRLTFALLGVATPADLIQDKSRTPFNIGQAIALEGFQPEEVQPLIPGLIGKAENPEAVLRIILEWTGGQPFLTQKLCKLVLQSAFEVGRWGDKGQAENGEWVEGLVRKWIIENWEGQDEPEHLKTIRDRILRSGEQRTGRLLGLCQQILQQGEVAADDSPEQTELRLTGLVVKRDGKLRIYNRIYQEVFNQDWCKNILDKLRPYSEAFTAWVAANYQDESCLLRGQALQNALVWRTGKSLSNLDEQFLAASQEFEKVQVQSALNAQTEANQILKQTQQRLAEAQRKTQRQIRLGVGVLVLSLALSVVGAIAALVVASKAKQEQSQAILERDKAKQEQSQAILERDKAQAEQSQAILERDKAQAEQKKAIDAQKAAMQKAKEAKEKFIQAQAKLNKALQDVTQKKQELQQATRQATVANDKAKLAAVQADKAKKDRNQALKDWQNAKDQVGTSESARQDAENRVQNTENALQNAENQRRMAESAQRNAENQRRMAESAQRNAENQLYFRQFMKH
ncbi:hypothetical protein F7734_12875 [Scytonema sp. UIC 10036]|uniref:AAA-like domain-containing protein n=1 Tax=Scytonema sp. UIC 10036 TaxID=2304196 RepID=UPI0012DAE3AD|nr:AAA-like domain-containing protein [Scytonema sp. UIC 10036]MUG93275.1 hypothetical protein [Scytonema sp. UIC 10036]